MDSVTDGSEELLLRGRGKVSITHDFSEGEVHAVKHAFWQRLAASHKKFAASHQEQMSLLMSLVLF